MRLAINFLNLPDHICTYTGIYNLFLRPDIPVTSYREMRFSAMTNLVSDNSPLHMCTVNTHMMTSVIPACDINEGWLSRRCTLD